MTVSLAGYPRGYSPEPQQSSFRPSAHPWTYLRPGIQCAPGVCTGTSLVSVRFQLLPLLPRRDHPPECGVSATPKSNNRHTHPRTVAPETCGASLVQCDTMLRGRSDGLTSTRRALCRGRLEGWSQRTRIAVG
jgi:hypothetical protein